MFSVKSDSNRSWSFYCDFPLYNMTTDLGVALFHSLEQSLTDYRIIVSLVLTNSISSDYFKRANVSLWVSPIYQWYWHIHNKSTPYFHLFIGQLFLLKSLTGRVSSCFRIACIWKTHTFLSDALWELVHTFRQTYRSKQLIII